MGCRCDSHQLKSELKNENDFSQTPIEKNLKFINIPFKEINLKNFSSKNFSNNNLFNKKYVLPIQNYSLNNLTNSLFYYINLIRTDPINFIEIIKKYIEKIIKKDNMIYIEINKDFYITLNKGKITFEECIESLKKIKNKKSFKLDDNLKFNFEDMFNNNIIEKIDDIEYYTSYDFLEKILIYKKNEINNLYDIKAFHYDKGCDNTEASAVLQIVDDSQADLFRRKNLLSNAEYIGISTLKLKDNVYCYYLLFANKK